MRTKNRTYLGLLWSVSCVSAISVASSHHYALPLKLGLLGVLILVVSVGSWAEITGAGPKMSERGLIWLKVILLILGPILGVLLYMLVRPYHTH